MPAEERGGAAPSAPRWLEVGAVAAAATLAGTGLAGLLLAVAGAFLGWLALGAGLVAGVASAVAIARALPASPPSRHATGAAAGAVALALAFLVVSAHAPSHRVLVNRDPGSYTSTAAWLARDGSLEVHAAEGGLERAGSLRYASYAVHDTGGGTLHLQFNHLTPVVLATALELAGPGAMFRVPALVAAIGLLLVYAAAVRATRRPWASLLAPALLGVSMPFLYVARDTFSEPVTMALLWGAVLTGAVVATRDREDAGSPTPRVGAAAVAGLLLGASVATRIDSLLLVAVAVVLCAGFVAAEPDLRRLRIALTTLAATAVGVLVGAADLELRSQGYATRHSDQVGLLRLAVVVAVLGGIAAVVAARRRPGSVAALGGIARRFAVPAAALTVAALLAGWWVRPHVHQMHGADEVPLVAGLQESAGVPVEATRRYGEMSLEWASWYLGPIALVVAILGAGLAVHRLLRGRRDPTTTIVTAALLVAGGLYWWRPSIVPDHVWAMRRFVPVVLPALAVMAAVLSARVLDLVPRRDARAALGAVVAAVLVVPAASTTWPVRQLREQHGYHRVVEEACELVGDDATVVVVGEPMVNTLPPALRGWCGLPVAAAVRPLTDGERDALRRDVAASGRTLVWVASDPDHLRGHRTGSAPVRTTTSAVEERFAERTLLRPPSRYAPAGRGWSLSVQREGA